MYNTVTTRPLISSHNRFEAKPTVKEKVWVRPPSAQRSLLKARNYMAFHN